MRWMRCLDALVGVDATALRVDTIPCHVLFCRLLLTLHVMITTFVHASARVDMVATADHACEGNCCGGVFFSMNSCRCLNISIMGGC